MTEDIEILLEILWYFQLMLVSTILHEFGHYFFAKYYRLDPKIRIIGRYICVVHKGKNYKENLVILCTGIMTGLIYILYWVLVSPFNFMNIAVIVGYIMASGSDILQIYYYIKRKK